MISAATFAPDSRSLLVAEAPYPYGLKRLKLYNLLKGFYGPELEVGISDDFDSLTFSPAGDLVLALTETGFVKLYRVDGKFDLRWSAYIRGSKGANRLSSASFSQDGKRVLTSRSADWQAPEEECVASVWDVQTGKGVVCLGPKPVDPQPGLRKKGDAQPR